MPGVHGGAAHEKVSPLQRRHHLFGLRLGVHNVVAHAPGHEEGDFVGGLRHIVDRRRPVIAEAILQRAESHEDFRQIALGGEDLVELPLGQHVVDAIHGHAGIHRRAHAGIRVLCLTGEFRPVPRQRHQGGQMPASRIAHDADAVHIHTQPRALGAQELHGGAHILHGLGKQVLGRKAIGDGEDADALPGEIRAQPRIALGAAALPGAAMDRHDARGVGIVRRQIEVADEGLLAPLHEFDVPDDLESLMRRVMHLASLPVGARRPNCRLAQPWQSGPASTSPARPFLSCCRASWWCSRHRRTGPCRR